MAVNMSQQELTQYVQALNVQVAQMSGTLDQAMKLIQEFQGTSDGAWTKISTRIGTVETAINAAEINITYCKDNLNKGGGHDKREMRLIDEKGDDSSYLQRRPQDVHVLVAVDESIPRQQVLRLPQDAGMGRG